MSTDLNAIRPIHENGKAITAEPSGDRVALIVWRKNGAPMLPLVLTKSEARALSRQLEGASVDFKRGVL
jgi:hypothetical protein